MSKTIHLKYHKNKGDVIPSIDIKDYMQPENRLSMKDFPQYNPEQFKNNSYPAQYVRDKVGRARSLNVIESFFDTKRNIHYRVALKNKDSNEIIVSYKEICTDFKWKKFEFDGQNIIIATPK